MTDVSGVELSLLGPPEVRVAGRVVAFKTRKALALLAYLALERGAHSRERLAGLLWPDSYPDAGRASLRNTLAYARDALGPAANIVVAQRNTVGLDPDASPTVDAVDLERAAGIGRSSTGDRAELASALEQAANACRGEFLAGLDLGEAGGFDEWLVARREECRRWTDLVLDRLSALQLDAGAAVAAAETAARWVALDRLNESAWRRLASTRLAAGQKASALEALAACRRTLLDELGVGLSPETLALEARLERSEGEPTAQGGRVPDLPSLLLEGGWVGRDAELSRLVEAYHAAAKGRANSVLVAGEPGIGKTRLAREFQTWAERQGAEVLRGRAFETSGGLPYGAVVDALGRRLRREPDPVALVGHSWLAELSSLMPELRDRTPDLPPAIADPDLARARLLEAVARTLLALAERAPLVLLIDDLQWADGGTLEALRYSARRLAEENASALLVILARDEALGPSSPLSAWLSGLSGEVPVSRLALRALKLDDTRRLLAGLGQAAPEDADRLAGWLQAETSGQPLFLTEALKGLIERGAVSREGAGGLRLDFARLGGGAEGVRAVIAGRLARLSPGALAVAQAAAALADHSAFDALRATAGLEEDDAVAGLEELLLAGLIREARDGGTAAESTYLLSHDRVREAAYAALSGPRRRALHRRALLNLEVLHAGRDEPVALHLSRHAEEAGDVERARVYLRRAGLRAARLGAAADALPLLERTLELTPATPENHEDRVGLLEGIAFALDELGGGTVRTVESHWRRAAERAAAAGLPREAAEALVWLALVLGGTGRSAEAEEAAQGAVAAARTSGGRSERGRALCTLGTTTLFRGDLVGAKALFERSLAAAREAGDPVLAAWALNSLGATARHRGDLDAAEHCYREELVLRRDLGRVGRRSVTGTLVDLAGTEMDRGDLAAALDYCREGQAEARRAGRVRDLWHATLELGAQRRLAGDLGAVEDLESALELARSSLGTREVASTLPLLGLALTRLGEDERARAMLDEAGKLVGKEEDLYRASATLSDLGELALELGELDGAEGFFRRALRAQLPRPLMRAAAGLAEALARRGDPSSAAELLGFLSANPPAGAHERDRLKRTLERLRAATPGPKLEAALERGRARTPADIVAEFATT